MIEIRSPETARSCVSVRLLVLLMMRRRRGRGERERTQEERHMPLGSPQNIRHVRFGGGGEGLFTLPAVGMRYKLLYMLANGH